jgi:hypothetical protein
MITRHLVFKHLFKFFFFFFSSTILVILHWVSGRLFEGAYVLGG